MTAWHNRNPPQSANCAAPVSSLTPLGWFQWFENINLNIKVISWYKLLFRTIPKRKSATKCCYYDELSTVAGNRQYQYMAQAD
jgi:hypothetical protein